MIALPDSNIRVLAPIETLHYFDTQATTLPREVSPLAAWTLMMDNPHPILKAAFKIRDLISKPFGVKPIGGFSRTVRDRVETGDRLDFFLVEYCDENTLVLTERDRHLDVMTCVSTRGPQLSITSSVSVHNLFGRVYMLPVGIAHKVIVRNMLRKLHRNVTAIRA